MPLESCVFLCLQSCRLCRGLYCVGVLASIECIVQSGSVCPVFFMGLIRRFEKQCCILWFLCDFYTIELQLVTDCSLSRLLATKAPLAEP